MGKDTEDGVAMEFFMTYGWAMLVIFAMIGALAYFGILSPNIEIIEEVPKYDFVCQNLDNNGSVFDEVIKSKSLFENTIGMRAVNIFGGEAEAMQWDDFGVMCNVPAQACQAEFVFCFDINLIVPVNYTEWDYWYYNITGGN